MHGSSTASQSGWLRRSMPRARRRALVVATYAGFAAFLAALYLGYTAEPRWPAWLALPAIALFIATAVAFVRLLAAPGYAADTLDNRLDERQRMVRDRAYRTSYYALTLLFGALSLAAMYLAGSETAWPALRQAAELLPWLTFLPGSLPSAVVAWTEPDLPDD